MDGMDVGSSPIGSDDPTSTTNFIQSQYEDTEFQNQSDETTSRESPPNVQVDDSPLQPCIHRNKESLKVKLLLRRPMNQLVEQGILPPPKTPPAFAGQRVRLERARMGDLLKAKIQQRPARQELIRQHILEECDARVAPSLAEKQRMLKRARLADSLNDHLIHRPGPLELVKKNILHAPDETIDQAIKEGVVEFKATSEGVFPGSHVPSSIYLSEDDSSSDLSSPAGTPDQSQSSSGSIENSKSSHSSIPQAESPSSSTSLQLTPTDLSDRLGTSPVSNLSVSVSSTVSTPPPPLPPPIVTHNIQNQLLSKIVKAAVTSSTIPPITSAQLTLSKLSTLEHQQLLSAVSQNQPLPRTTQVQQGSSTPSFSQHLSSKIRSSKKSSNKIKTQPKARQIKFHEYKGPPSAQKGLQQTQMQEVESSYELLLQQQQLFLQWQLECRHKYPQIILPAVSKLGSPTEVAGTFASAVCAATAAAVSMHPGSIVAATASSPTVRSPSTISSVTNSNNTGSPGQQPIAPAPPPITVQALVEKYNKNTATVSASLPLKLNLSSTGSSNVAEIRPKLTPSRSIDNSSSTKNTPLDMGKLNDWKVSDLKAELKKRNLPVSGPKPQLIERLKSSDVSLQDESISSSSNGNGPKQTTTIKSEVTTASEENSSTELMDVSDTQQTTHGNQTPTLSVNGVTSNQTEGFGKTSNVAALNAAMLTLLQNNNLQRNGVIPVHILNALANVAKNVNSNSNGAGGSTVNGKTQNIVVVDEKVLREQQIEQLQQALQNSQAQHQQMKVAQQNWTGQKHRIALQQHLQQKMQQQALQAQLQKLIQLHKLQQQVQKETAEQPMTGKLLTNPQQPQIQILPQTKPQKAGTITLHQSEEEEEKKPLTSLNENSEENQVPSKLNERSNIPFTIVKIGTTPTPNSVTKIPENSEPPSPSIPKLEIAPGENPAFQPGESESSGSPKSMSFSSESSDPMDHSWLLKIHEVPTPTEPKKSVVKEFANFFESFANPEKKEEPKLQIPKARRGFKSQMVDDVLEILIRNGELPPSAAQDPSTPIKSPQILEYPTPPPNLENPTITLIPPIETTEILTKSSSILSTPPPPPPPLPPPSFAITLPTSITFSRPSNNFNPLHQSAADQVNAQLTHQNIDMTKILPPPPYQSTTLSKEAQDILKISQDLSNFGKAHAETESHRLFSATLHDNTVVHDLQRSSGDEVMSHLDYDSNTLAMLLDDVPNLVDMDAEMGLEDTTTTTTTTTTSHGIMSSSSQSSMTSHYDQHRDSGIFEEHFPSGINNIDQIPMSVDGQGLIDGRVIPRVDPKHDDLLDELGTLLPNDLDVSMPMEMDYSDWLEQLLPENQSDDTYKESPGLNTSFVSNNNNDIGTNNNFFMMDYNNSDNFGHRDPLLSSRSFNIFGSEVLGSGSGFGDSEMKTGNNRAPSPMTMGENLLWDFA